MLRDDIKVLTLEEIAQATDREETVLDVPEWGGPVVLKALSLKQRDLIFSLANEGTGKEIKLNGQKLVHLLVLYGVVQPQFTEDVLQDKAFAVVDRIAQKVMAMSGLAPEAALVASKTF